MILVAAFIAAAIHHDSLESSHQVQVVEINTSRVYECVVTLQEVYEGDVIKFCKDMYKE